MPESLESEKALNGWALDVIYGTLDDGLVMLKLIMSLPPGDLSEETLLSISLKEMPSPDLAWYTATQIPVVLQWLLIESLNIVQNLKNMTHMATLSPCRTLYGPVIHIQQPEKRNQALKSRASSNNSSGRLYDCICQAFAAVQVRLLGYHTYIPTLFLRERLIMKAHCENKALW